MLCEICGELISSFSADDVAFICERFTCSHGRNWITINYYWGRTLHRVRYGRSSVSQPRRRALLTSGIAQTALGVRQSARYTCGSHRECVLACITLLQRNHFRDFYVSLYQAFSYEIARRSNESRIRERMGARAPLTERGRKRKEGERENSEGAGGGR